MLRRWGGWWSEPVKLSSLPLSCDPSTQQATCFVFLSSTNPFAPYNSDIVRARGSLPDSLMVPAPQNIFFGAGVPGAVINSLFVCVSPLPTDFPGSAVLYNTPQAGDIAMTIVQTGAGLLAVALSTTATAAHLMSRQTRSCCASSGKRTSCPRRR